MSEPNFSQREGIEPLKKKPQIKSMDIDLRNGLWNIVSRHYFPVYYSDLDKHYELHDLFVRIYEDFFKEASDEIPDKVYEARKIIRDTFYSIEYNKVYDFVEFLGKFPNQTHIRNTYAEEINAILNREFSGYVFVSGKIMPRISEREILEIEKAAAGPLHSVNEHIKQAIALLSNKEKPDYRNSIKESISAVESILQKITGSSNVDLHKALDLLKKQGNITVPPPLLGAIDQIYGYASSFQGIRHAKPYQTQDDATQEEALFMVSWCSAFVNFLVVKSEKSKIVL